MTRVGHGCPSDSNWWIFPLIDMQEVIQAIRLTQIRFFQPNSLLVWYHGIILLHCYFQYMIHYSLHSHIYFSIHYSVHQIYCRNAGRITCASVKVLSNHIFLSCQNLIWFFVIPLITPFALSAEVIQFTAYLLFWGRYRASHMAWN